MELLDKYGVYLITCRANSKVYVGSSCDIKRRVKSHYVSLKNGNSHNKHLQSSWDKYGGKCFSIVVIEYCIDKEGMLKREKYWIHELQSFKKEKGFNKTTETKNPSGRKCSKEYLEWRSKHESNKWKNLSPEEKKKRIEKLKFASSCRKNFKKTRSAKIKRSRKMVFIRISDGMTFRPELPSEFMEKHGLDRSACHKAAKGKTYKATDSRHGGEYKVRVKQHKGFKIFYE